MANDAHISLFGTVVADPKNVQVNGATVLNMRVAVTTTKKQENSKFPASDLYEVAVWGKQAEGLINRVGVKSKVWVNGDFMTGPNWKDKSGKEHVSLHVTANSVKVVPTNNAQAGNNNAQSDDDEPLF